MHGADEPALGSPRPTGYAGWACISATAAAR